MGSSPFFFLMRLIDWMVFYAAFNSISIKSRRQLTLFMLSWVSPVLGWALKCLAQGHSHEKTQRIQCGSNPGLLLMRHSSPKSLERSHMYPRYFYNGHKISSIFTTQTILLQPLYCHLRPWAYFAESVDQDQTAHTCSLILLCTLRCYIINFIHCHLITWNVLESSSTI